MNEIKEFLKSLTTDQLKSLDYLLESGIDGDIDYFMFRIREELKDRKL